MLIAPYQWMGDEYRALDAVSFHSAKRLSNSYSVAEFHELRIERRIARRQARKR